MKSYDKIFVANELTEQETDYKLARNGEPYCLIGLDRKDYVIVLTRKELHDLLDDICYEITEKGMGRYSVIHHFTNNYLCRKINI